MKMDQSKEMSRNNHKVSFNERSSTIGDDNENNDFIFILKQLAKKKCKQLSKILIIPTAHFVNGEPKLLMFNEKV